MLGECEQYVTSMTNACPKACMHDSASPIKLHSPFTSCIYLLILQLKFHESLNSTNEAEKASINAFS